MADEFDVLLEKNKKQSTVTVGGAPLDIESTVTPEQQAAAATAPSEFDALLEKQKAPKDVSEFDALLQKQEKAPFKYQQDPEIQRIAGTPEERKAVGTVGTIEQKEIPFKDLYTKPENLKVIKDYAETRFGESGKQRKDESDEDYTKRWMTAMRQVEWNTTLNAVPELIWLNSAKPEEVVKAARAHNLFNAVPSFYSAGGQPGIRPLAEGFLSAATDIANVPGMLLGSRAASLVAKQAIKNTLASKAKQMGIAAGVETTIGVGQSAIDQAVARKTGTQRDEADYFQYGISALVGAVAGGAEVGLAMKGKIPFSKDVFEARLAGKKVLQAEDPAYIELKKRFADSQAELDKEFDMFEGRKILNELSPETELTEAQIKKSVHEKAIDVAMYVMYNSPEYMPKPGQKISKAVQNIVDNLDNLDENVFEAALSRANITPKEFADSILTSVGDSGKVLNTYSVLSKAVKKLTAIDPEAQKRLDEVTDLNKNQIWSAVGAFFRAIKRGERETKALVVSGLGTTVRNIEGTSVALTADAMSRLVENIIISPARAYKAITTGNASVGATTEGIKDIISDSFLTLSYLRQSNSGLTAEIVENLLTHNPKIKNQMFSALQESGTDELSKFAKVANTLNVAQDVFFRRAIFASSVDRQLKQIGIKIDDVMANNKTVPTEILKKAADETLKATFSYQPKQKGFGNLEDAGETVGYYFVKLFELPGMSLAVTFPRFMSNAVAFQYRHSPVGALSGITEMGVGALKLASGTAAAQKLADKLPAALRKYIPEKDGGEALIRQGLEKFSRGVVGSSAMLGAYAYRMENQDTKPYEFKNSDGSTTDMRGIFPAYPYFMIGDYFAKKSLGRETEFKAADLFKAISGLEKLPGGSSAYLLDQLEIAFNNAEGKEADRFETAMGKVLGDFTGRVLTPGKPLYDYFELFREESQIARDPNVIGPYYPKKEQAQREARGEVSQIEKYVTGASPFEQAALQRLMNKLPILKEYLPEAQTYFSEKAPVRAGEFFTNLTGVRTTPVRKSIEKEMVGLNMDPYTFYGRTGDKVYDRSVILESVKPMERAVGNLIKSTRYQNYTRPEKKQAIIENMQDAVTEGRGIANAKLMASDFDRVSKMRWEKLTANQRMILNAMSKEATGKTFDEAAKEDSKKYQDVFKYEGMLATIR